MELTLGEDKLTADVAVQDEKMTAFKLVSKNLVADPDVATTASISYKAVNQYGEMMAPGNVEPTCSFGNVDKTDKLVEGNLKSKTKVTDYYVMMNVQDQYGSDMTVADIKGSKCDLSFNPASVLTNLTVAEKKIDSTTTSTNIKDITYDGKSCILVKLATSDAAGTTLLPSGEISKAGTLTLTIVSANKDVVASPSFTVEDGVTIASLSVSPADAVYNNTDNKLVVEAIDTNGNAVTKYDDLKNSIGYQTTGVSLKKNADGKKLTIAAPTTAKKGTATLFLQYASATRVAESQTLDATNFEKYYDLKVDLSVADTSSVTASDLTLNVNNGKTVCGIAEVILTPATSKSAQTVTNGAVNVVVTGRVGGKTVVIPTTDWTIISGNTLGGYGAIDKATNTVEKTETKTITVVVDSEDGPQTLTADVVVSNADPKATEIKKSEDNGNTITKSSVGAVTSAELQSTVDIFDQYGIKMTVADAKVVYNVTITGNNQAKLKVEKNGTQNAKIVAADGVTLSAGDEFTASVKYAYSGVEFTQDITIKF